jgi:hypothetical protein
MLRGVRAAEQRTQIQEAEQADAGAVVDAIDQRPLVEERGTALLVQQSRLIAEIRANN